MKIEDGNWCFYEVEVIIDNSEELDIYVEVEGGVCGNFGLILIMMLNGLFMYGIFWSGFVSGFVLIFSYYYLLEDLFLGIYFIIVEDSNWCFEYVIV